MSVAVGIRRKLRYKKSLILLIAYPSTTYSPDTKSKALSSYKSKITTTNTTLPITTHHYTTYFTSHLYSQHKILNTHYLSPSAQPHTNNTQLKPSVVSEPRSNTIGRKLTLKLFHGRTITPLIYSSTSFSR